MAGAAARLIRYNFLLMQDESHIQLDVFGDQSAGPEVVSYGIFVVPSHQVATTEATLEKIKVQYGRGAKARLHCREMFSGEARRKTEWADLSIDDVFSLYAQLITTISNRDIQKIAAVARKTKFPRSIPGAGVWPKIELGDEQLAASCGNAVMIPFAQNPGFSKIRFWADANKSKILWMGQKRQAINALDGFIDIGANAEPPRVRPQPLGGPIGPLLEVADFVAYICQRGLSRRSNNLELKSRYRNLFKLSDITIIEMGRKPDGSIGFQVPNSLLHR